MSAGGPVSFVAAHAAALVAAVVSLAVVVGLRRVDPSWVTERFAALAAAVTTAGLVGFWVVARWLFDVARSAAFPETNATLMWRFVAVMVVAAVAAALAPVVSGARGDTAPEGRA